MVKLFPKNTEQLIDKGAPESEQKVHNLFKNLNNDWYVWHSVEWLQRKENGFLRLGESDFLIFNPTFGYLVLEVKGGKIKRNLIRTLPDYYEDYGGEWSRDYFKKGKFFENRPLKNNPFYQARKSMHYFLDFYRDYINNLKLRNLIDDDLYNKLLYRNSFPGNFHFGVVFPDCNFKDYNDTPMREIVKEMIFDSIDKAEQEKWMEKLPDQRNTESPIEKYLKRLFGMYPIRIPPVELKKYFLDLIEYEITTSFSLHSWLDDQRYFLNIINKIQDFTLDLLEFKRRCLFNGSAGTGKTFIAMKKFTRECQNGKKSLFLCYNRKLNQFVENYLQNNFKEIFNKGTAEYRITTIYRLFHSIARNELDKVKYDIFRNKIKNNKFEEITDTIRNILLNQDEERYTYDAIIVDEGQDIRTEYWPIINSLLKDKKKSIFYIFYDQTQLKFNKNFDPTKTGLDILSDRMFLNKNLRNADEIIHWIQKETKLGTYRDFLGISSIKQDFKPEHFSNLQEALAAAMLKIFDLHENSIIHPKRFTILCDKIFFYLIPRGYKIKESNVNKVKFLQRRYGMAAASRKLEYLLVETTNLNDLDKIREALIEKTIISFNGIGTFKGLENDIIMLIVQKPDESDNEQMDNYLRDVYIGASRAKFLLYIYTYSTF